VTDKIIGRRLAEWGAKWGGSVGLYDQSMFRIPKSRTLRWAMGPNALLDPEDEELCESMAINGLMTPILVSKDMIVINGRRRLLAAQRTPLLRAFGARVLFETFDEMSDETLDRLYATDQLLDQKNE